MYPHERSLVKKLEGKSFALVGVNSDKDREKIKEDIKKEEITWRSFWNGEKGTQGPISKEWKIRGWPTLYVIDDKGIIRHKHLGSPDPPEELDREIEKLLAEMGKK